MTNPTPREERTIRAIWKYYGAEKWATAPIGETARAMAQLIHDVIDGKIPGIGNDGSGNNSDVRP